MEIIGRIIELLPIVSGETDRGEWTRGGIVVETLTDFPVTLQLDLADKRLEEFRQKFPSPLGIIVKARFGISSRKIGDKWFTNARAWEVNPY